MLAEDIKPNRLSNSKKIIERIISKLNNDKFGLVVFAGDAFIQMPITQDVRSAYMFLSTINTEIVPIQGTAVGKALEIASKSFTSDNEISKIIILITDGENHEDDALEVAKNLKTENINIFTVGVGSPNGAPIPNKKRGGFIKDKDGNTVMSNLDEKTLIEIANTTNGIYVRADNSSSAVDNILAELNKMQKGEVLKQDFSEYDEQFQYFALFALFLLLLDLLISERKNSIISKIDLFKQKNK